MTGILKIDIAVATIGRRIEGVARMLLPPLEGVAYVVSWQGHQGISLPEQLRRDDVEVCRFDGSGLSRNRNNAIAHCRGDIVVISDDDLVYHPESILNVRKAFAADNTLDIALFKVDFPHAKKYPSGDCPIGLPFPKGYWVSAVEIALRRDRISSLRFNPILGLGAGRYECGEDECFVISAIRRGLNCRFINHTLCAHPGTTTGSYTSPGTLRGQGYVISLMYPHSGYLRLLLKAVRLWRSGKCGGAYALRYLLHGAAAQFRYRRRSSGSNPECP